MPKKAEKREQVSIAPPQAWVNLTPSSCGKQVKKCPASLAYVSGRSSYSARTRPPYG
ncbi:hypothetical protein SALBM217S_08462 [Streptomyces griseoloalbus]